MWTVKFNTCVNSVESSGSKLVGVGGRKENTASPQYGYARIFIFLIKGKAMLIGACTSPLGLQEVEAPRISRHSAYERGEVVSPT